LNFCENTAIIHHVVGKAMRCLQIFSSQVPIVMCGKSPLSPPARGRGFTLVELLVVAGIIAVLVALLLPAINSVREAGRRTACTANLNRLALAMTQFDTQHGGLPGWRNRLPLVGGVQTRWGANSRQASWAVMLLPLLERNDVYAEMAANRLWGDQSPKQGLLMPEFLCPSFKPKTQRYDYSVLHYGVNVGSGVDPDDGVLVDNLGAHRMSLEDVNAGDGTAFTMLHSEGAFGGDEWPGGWGPAWHEVAGDQWHHKWQQNNSPFRNSKLLPFGFSGGPVTKVLNGSVKNLSLPRSKHPGGVVMAFCDGHTKFVKESLAPHIFAHLVTSATCWNSSTRKYEPFNSRNAQNWLRASGAPSLAEEPYQLKDSDY
jgi:prepilin-type N-terminal cleavage/methylation domain-containing protein/prepilin-type processing-associated H-X9-DG protein